MIVFNIFVIITYTSNNKFSKYLSQGDIIFIKTDTTHLSVMLSVINIQFTK